MIESFEMYDRFLFTGNYDEQKYYLTSFRLSDDIRLAVERMCLPFCCEIRFVNGRPQKYKYFYMGQEITSQEKVIQDEIINEEIAAVQEYLEMALMHEKVGKRCK